MEKVLNHEMLQKIHNQNETVNDWNTVFQIIPI